MVEGLYSACGKILNLIWRNCYVFGQPFNVLNSQIRKNNLAIWSHWIDVLLRFVCDIGSCDPAEHFHCFNVSIFAPLLSHFPTYRLSVEDKWSNASKWRTLSKAARWRLVPSWGLRQLPVMILWSMIPVYYFKGGNLLTLTKYFRDWSREFHWQKVAKLAIIFVYFCNKIVSLTSRESCNGYI